MEPLQGFLFCGPRLDDILRDNLQGAVQAVNDIPERQFAGSTDSEIEDHVYSRMEILPIDLHQDDREMDSEETRIDVSQYKQRVFHDRRGPFYVPAIRITVSIPFVGDSRLWKASPNALRSLRPTGSIRVADTDTEGGHLDLIIERAMDLVHDGKQLDAEIDSALSEINWYIHQVNGQVSGHNQSLKESIRKAILNRRQRLGKRAEITNAMNIPLKRRSGTPDIIHLPIKRRIVKPLHTKTNKPPEPAVSDEEYEYILKIIRHEGRTWETSPATYSVHDEEGLRDIILSHLNTHYEGGATGETFRKSGKTDIRIEDNERSAFVGECKIWRGPRELSNAIDQLLSYLTWRDCKAALILFNKNIAGFSAIQRKVSEVIQDHPNYLRTLTNSETWEWRFRAKSIDDPEREITIHVFLFNIYVRSTDDEGASV